MREIKFRGKDAVTGEWFYGYYNQTRLSDGELVAEIRDMVNDYPSYQYFRIVDPSTAGQYTGLKDKNGIEIYEGDKIFDEHREYWGYVEFDEGCFHAVLENVCYKLFEVQDEIQVIGNIYEDEGL